MTIMAEPLDLTPQLLEQAMQTGTVRAAIEARAQRLLPRAQRLAAQAGAMTFGRALRVEAGTRPGAQARDGVRRPYARVVADVTPVMDEADADATLSRRQILRRAAAGA